MASPPWLRNLSRSFKQHRLGRTGWYVEVMRDRLRVVSAELPPRPDEPPGSPPKRRAVTLQAPPGPATAAAGLAEACALFDAVMAGYWRWPNPDAPPPADDPGHLSATALNRLVEQLRAELVGERMGERTWARTWLPYLRQLAATAEQGGAGDDAAFLARYLRRWQANSRARQMAYDRARALWKHAGWPWPKELAQLRGNGKAAADPDGVRAFTDEEISELRSRIEASARLTPSDLLAWDCLTVFGLRPQELIDLEIKRGPRGGPVAVVTRSKRSSKGSTRPRQVPAVPPAGWPADCHRLLARWKAHGLPEWSQRLASPGEHLSQQLRRLRMPQGLTAYGLRHAFALRLGVELGLHVREAAELCGHSPAVHLATYGRRLDGPALRSKVAELVAARS
ncbi:site-specific recombinase, phage integrase family protein [Cyanobium sp. PCC 7001]|nr:site-specific recombinase, phage integrase family protein [Cyanobium sp. PCC 7001]